MSSRRRYLLYTGAEGYFCGSQAVERLRASTGGFFGSLGKLRSTADFARQAKLQGWRFWVFREPKGTEEKKSRYKKLVRYLGLGKPRYKNKKVEAQQGMAAPAQPEGQWFFQAQPPNMAAILGALDGIH